MLLNGASVYRTREKKERVMEGAVSSSFPQHTYRFLAEWEVNDPANAPDEQEREREKLNKCMHVCCRVSRSSLVQTWEPAHPQFFFPVQKISLYSPPILMGDLMQRLRWTFEKRYPGEEDSSYGAFSLYFDKDGWKRWRRRRREKKKVSLVSSSCAAVAEWGQTHGALYIEGWKVHFYYSCARSVRLVTYSK